MFFLLTYPFSCSGSQGSVIINEIAWMGTDISANNEWIELKNTNQEAVLLNEWQLKAEDGTPNIELKGEIDAGGFLILERTNDSSCPDVKADIIYKGALSNSGETLTLLNDKGAVMDRIEALDRWPAGDNKTKQTMERKHGFMDWQTSVEAGGTPGKENSEPIQKKKREGALVNKDFYTIAADKRFFEAFLSALTSSFCFASLTLIMKRGIKR